MKISKTDAKYTERPAVGQGQCEDCTMFREGPVTDYCTAVSGPIKPDAHCRLFERKK